MANIIDAIYNLINNPINHLTEYYHGRNRANNSGDALEEYIKDLFCNSFNMETMERLEEQQKVFSYLGNNSNPPDAMLNGGDAIEVKKIETDGAALALNSSYPKHTLKASSPMISSACKSAEIWSEKDMLYVVGIVNKGTNDLRHLCMVYGLDYCALEECYARIKTTIKNGVEGIPEVDFAETEELGRINRIDPLGITYMRIRGMWGIDNPWKVFSYVYERSTDKEFDFMCIINDEKWKTFDNTEKIENLNIDGFAIKEIRIKNPDNPAQLRNAKLITYEK